MHLLLDAKYMRKEGNDGIRCDMSCRLESPYFIIEAKYEPHPNHIAEFVDKATTEELEGKEGSVSLPLKANHHLPYLTSSDRMVPVLVGQEANVNEFVSRSEICLTL
jgi:hypothetical protein